MSVCTGVFVKTKNGHIYELTSYNLFVKKWCEIRKNNKQKFVKGFLKQIAEEWRQSRTKQIIIYESNKPDIPLFIL
jgi:hypothetical protein